MNPILFLRRQEQGSHEGFHAAKLYADAISVAVSMVAVADRQDAGSE